MAGYDIRGMPFRDRMGARKIAFASRMHRNPTPTEAALWERLKGRKLGIGFKFQEAMLGYIADFYCPGANLVVELDGTSHESAQRRAEDARRDSVFERHGIAVLHIPASKPLDEQVRRIEQKLGFLQAPRAKRPAA